MRKLNSRKKWESKTNSSDFTETPKTFLWKKMKSSNQVVTCKRPPPPHTHATKKKKNDLNRVQFRKKKLKKNLILASRWSVNVTQLPANELMMQVKRQAPLR